VWHQPYSGGELLPFRPDVSTMGRTFLADPPHGRRDGHAAWNGGRHDQYVPNNGLDTMTYHTREDLPFQYALADAFTICDDYHCSLLGPTASTSAQRPPRRYGPCAERTVNVVVGMREWAGASSCRRAWASRRDPFDTVQWSHLATDVPGNDRAAFLETWGTGGQLDGGHSGFAVVRTGGVTVLTTVAGQQLADPYDMRSSPPRSPQPARGLTDDRAAAGTLDAAVAPEREETWIAIGP
jgi:hypothetical protein